MKYISEPSRTPPPPLPPPDTDSFNVSWKTKSRRRRWSIGQLADKEMGLIFVIEGSIERLQLIQYSSCVFFFFFFGFIIHVVFIKLQCTHLQVG